MPPILLQVRSPCAFQNTPRHLLGGLVVWVVGGAELLFRLRSFPSRVPGRPLSDDRPLGIMTMSVGAGRSRQVSCGFNLAPPAIAAPWPDSPPAVDRLQSRHAGVSPRDLCAVRNLLRQFSRCLLRDSLMAGVFGRVLLAPATSDLFASFRRTAVLAPMVIIASSLSDASNARA